MSWTDCFTVAILVDAIPSRNTISPRLDALLHTRSSRCREFVVEDAYLLSSRIAGVANQGYDVGPTCVRRELLKHLDVFGFQARHAGVPTLVVRVQGFCVLMRQ